MHVKPSSVTAAACITGTTAEPACNRNGGPTPLTTDTSAPPHPASPPAEQVPVSQVEPPRDGQRRHAREHLARVALIACANRSFIG